MYGNAILCMDKRMYETGSAQMGDVEVNTIAQFLCALWMSKSWFHNEFAS